MQQFGYVKVVGFGFFLGTFIKCLNVLVHISFVLHYVGQVKLANVFYYTFNSSHVNFANFNAVHVKFGGISLVSNKKNASQKSSLEYSNLIIYQST